ncbi:MAG: NAD-dependent epimerase/dehydratase family protein [Chloroflexi bacterium]|nr:NAD-dependent epimerase/dehydratase family protein [Chloroflexota bacterium]
MLVLVTGANGHIGANVTRALIKAGYDVRAMVREGADTRGLQGLALKMFYGDIRDTAAVEASMRDCEVVINLATPYITNPSRRADVIDPAMEGVRNVLQAAARLGVRRVVHASSMAAIGPSKDPARLRTEQDWFDEADMPYTIAKRDSERIAWTLAEALDVPFISLNPPVVLGRFDYRITPSTRWVLDMVEGTAMLPKGAVGLVHVLDVADALVSAIERGRPGERYIIAGPSVHFKNLVETIRDMTGNGPQYMPAPRPLVLGVISMQAGLLKMMGRPVLASVGAAQEWVHRYQVYDTAKARNELGLSSHTAEEILTEVIQWSLHMNQFSPATAARLQPRYSTHTDWN